MSATTALLNIGVHGLALAVFVFVFVFGGRSERIGAGIYAGNAVLIGVAQVFAHFVLDNGYPIAAFVALDFATSLAFAWLAISYPEKLWPGVAGCAQFLVFVFSVSRVVHFPLDDVLLVRACNIAGLAIQATLVVGAWKARWGGSRRDEWDQFEDTLQHLAPKPTH